MVQLTHKVAEHEFLGALTHLDRPCDSYIRFDDQVVVVELVGDPAGRLELSFDACLRQPPGSLFRQAADLVPKAELVEQPILEDSTHEQGYRTAYAFDVGLRAINWVRIRDLEAENARLRNLVAELAQDRDVLQELIIRSAQIPGGEEEVTAPPPWSSTRAMIQTTVEC